MCCCIAKKLSKDFENSWIVDHLWRPVFKYTAPAACLSFLFDKNLIWHEQIFSSLPPIEHFWQEPKILIFSQNDPGVSEAVQTWQFNFGLLPSKIV